MTGAEGTEEQGIAPRAIGHLFRGINDANISGLSVRYEVRLGRVAPKQSAVGVPI